MKQKIYFVHIRGTVFLKFDETIRIDRTQRNEKFVDLFIHRFSYESTVWSGWMMDQQFGTLIGKCEF